MRTFSVLRQYLGHNPDPAEVAAALREHGETYLLRVSELGQKSLTEIEEWLIETGHSPDGMPAQHPARTLSPATQRILKWHFGYYPLPEEVARTP